MAGGRFRQNDQVGLIATTTNIIVIANGGVLLPTIVDISVCVCVRNGQVVSCVGLFVVLCCCATAPRLDRWSPQNGPCCWATTKM